MKKTECDGWADRLARARLRKFPTTWQASRALHRLDPDQLPDAKTLHRYWSERWETGRIRPNRTYRELIERLLDSPGLFQDPLAPPTVQYPVVVSRLPVQAVQPVASPARITPPTVGDARFASRDGLGREVRMTADESAEHAAMSGVQVSDRTLEQLHDDIVGLARGYTHRPLPEVFSTARQTRDIAVRLIEHTRRPGQLADLYVVAGQACGLLSTAAFDMGYWDAAARLADAGLTTPTPPATTRCAGGPWACGRSSPTGRVASTTRTQTSPRRSPWSPRAPPLFGFLPSVHVPAR